jgi:hypothetical protein
MPGTLLKLYGKHRRVFESVLIIVSSSAIITFGKSYTLKEFREHNAFDVPLQFRGWFLYHVLLPGLSSHASSNCLCLRSFIVAGRVYLITLFSG